MDRNALLIATRAEFLQAYLAAYDICRPNCVDEAFRQADASRSSLEQHHLLIAGHAVRLSKRCRRHRAAHTGA